MNEEAIRLVAGSPSLLAGIHSWGIEVIKAIQKIESPGLTVVIKYITAMGSEYFYVPLLLVIFWCIDEKKGLRLGLLIVISAWINLLLKDLFWQPRPYNLDPSVGLAFESSGGLPSGHAQMSLVFWAFLAVWGGDISRRRRPLLIRGEGLIPRPSGAILRVLNPSPKPQENNNLVALPRGC
jgi:membrane-associated phospholipid phosphatase